MIFRWIKRAWAALTAPTVTYTVESYTVNGRPMTEAERAAFDAAFAAMHKAFEQMGDAFDLTKRTNA